MHYFTINLFRYLIATILLYGMKRLITGINC